MNASPEPNSDETSPRSHGLPRGLELGALVVVALLVFAAAARQIAAVDYWWQLATGKFVLGNGWPSTDVFSYSATDHAWIELRWLYCVALELLVESFGVGAAILVKVGLVAATLTIAAACAAGRRTLLPALALAFLAVLAMSNRLYLRPELISGLLLISFVAIIHRERAARASGRAAGRWRAVHALPLLQLVWVNSHTLFILGPAVVGAWFVAEAIARATGWGGRSATRSGSRQGLVTSGIVLAATSFACLVNPWLLEGAIFPLTLFQQLGGTAYSTEIRELRGPFAVAATGPAIPTYVALLVLTAVAAVANLRRTDAFLAICTAAFAFLSTLAVRNVPLFVTVAIPFLIVSLRDMSWPWRDSLTKLRHGLHVGVAVTLLVAGLFCSWLLVTDRFSRAHNSRFGFGVNPYSHPIAAVDFLEENGVIGERVFNYLNEGAYLLYRGYPVYFDPRLEVYGEDHLLEYRRIGADTEAFATFAEENDVHVVVQGLGVSQFEFLERQVATGLWRLVYLDHQVYILVRDGFAPQLAVADFDKDRSVWLDRYRRVLPEAETAAGGKRLPLGPYVRLAEALFLARAIDLSETFFRDALYIAPDNVHALEGAGRVAVAREDFDSAVEYFRRALARADRDSASRIERRFRIASGNRNIRRKEYAEALREFERAYEIRADAGVAAIIERLRRETGKAP